MSNPYSKRKRYALDVEAWVQFKLLRLAALHPDTTKADLAVFAEVIQQYKGWSGKGFVSDQQICALTDLNERTVRRSRKNLVRLGFVEVVRAGGRGHATEYTPNFGMVPQKADILVLDKKADIPVLETDENVHLNDELPDILTRPSYPQDRFLTGPLRDRLDHRPPTAPDGDGLKATPPVSAVEELPNFQAESLPALLAAYCPADMSKPARAAYKKAWEAIQPDTDLATVIDAAADWHESWGAQNNPEAPRMSLVRWLKDEMWLRPAPKGFNKVERPTKAKVSVSGQNPNKPRHPTGPITARITATEVITHRFGISDLHLTTDDGTNHVIVLESDDADAQYAGQKELARLVHAVGLTQISDDKELLGRTVKLVGGEERFAPPDARPDDEPPMPVAPEPAPPPPPPAESAREFAARMAREINDPWPEWMDAEQDIA